MTETPAVDKDDAQKTAVPEPAPAGLRGVVLIAEDEEQIRKGLVRFLSGFGHTVLEAADGRAALELARERKPNVVLLDITMPEKNGLEVLRELCPAMPSTGFVMVTGNDDEETALSCLQLGAFDYIPKPVDLEALRHCVDAWLMLHRPSAR